MRPDIGKPMNKHQKRSPVLDDDESDERTAFVTRLQAVAELVGSVNALAKRAGLSQTGLRGYLFGSEPTRPALYAIADAAGVARSWLFNGDAPMFSAGSERQEEALEHVRRAWNAFGKEQGGGERDWNEFAERYRIGDKALALPAWVRFAVPNAREMIQGRPGESHEAAAARVERPGFTVPAGLFASVARELRKLMPGVEAATSTQVEAFDEVLDSACRDLLAGAVVLGRAPDKTTIRMMINCHLWRLGIAVETAGRPEGRELEAV